MFIFHSWSSFFYAVFIVYSMTFNRESCHDMVCILGYSFLSMGLTSYVSWFVFRRNWLATSHMQYRMHEVVQCEVDGKCFTATLNVAGHFCWPKINNLISMLEILRSSYHCIVYSALSHDLNLGPANAPTLWQRWHNIDATLSQCQSQRWGNFQIWIFNHRSNVVWTAYQHCILTLIPMLPRSH